jgi:hypothetical protein
MANELKKRGMAISLAGVRWVCLRHDLENIKKRLKALEAKSLQEGLILIEAQMVTLEKKEAHGNSRANVVGTVEHKTPFT